MWRSPSQISSSGRPAACLGRASSAILGIVSRRAHDSAPKAHAPTLTSTNDDFSAEELDFFKRGDELQAPLTESTDTPDGD
jgi:hypothetical protein